MRSQLFALFSRLTKTQTSPPASSRVLSPPSTPVRKPSSSYPSLSSILPTSLTPSPSSPPSFLYSLMTSSRVLILLVVGLIALSVWSAAIVGMSLPAPPFLASLLWGSASAYSASVPAALSAHSSLLCPLCPVCPTASGAVCPTMCPICPNSLAVKPLVCPDPPSSSRSSPSSSSFASLPTSSIEPRAHMASSLHSFPRLVTVVTAFFPPGASSSDRAKHPLDKYKIWLGTFFTHSFHNTPLYVYTSPAYYPVLAFMRYRNVFRDLQEDDFTLDTINNLTAIASRRILNPGFELDEIMGGLQMAAHFDVSFNSPLDTPVMVPLQTALTERQPALDKERHIHSPHLYAVWNSKPYFVNHSAEVNVWSTPYFMWIDAGALRNETWRLPRWPNERRWRYVFEHEDTLFLKRQVDRWDLFEREMEPNPKKYTPHHTTLHHIPRLQRPLPRLLLTSASLSTAATASCCVCRYWFNLTVHANRYMGRRLDGKGKALILYGALGRLPFDGIQVPRRKYCNSNYTVTLPPLLAGEEAVWNKQKANAEFVQGTFWAGNVESVRWYANMYYDTINGYVQRDWFMGDEQHVMTAISIAHANHFRFYHTYQYPWGFGQDPWFSLPFFFADAEVLRENFPHLPPYLFHVDQMISDATAMCFD